MTSKYSPWGWLRNRVTRTVGLVVLLLWSLSTLFPLFWTLSTSFKTNEEVFANTWGLPNALRWENYFWALEKGNMLISLRNSVIITAGAIVILFLIAPMAAYTLGRAEFLGKRATFYALLGGMYIAPQILLVPMYILLNSLSLVNKHLGLILVYAASGLPYCVFMARLGFLSVPSSLEDSARVDGLSTFQIYWRISLPLAMPTVLIALILETIFIWNDFLYPLVFLRSTDMFTLPLGLFVFQGMYMVKYGPLAAGVIISTVPLLILYILFSDRVKKGVAASLGVKG